MYGLLKKLVANKQCIHEWAFSEEVFMVEVTEKEEIGKATLEGQGFLYILMQIHKSWTSYSKLGFSTRLEKGWSNLDQKGLLPNPHMSLVSQSPSCLITT